MLSRACQVVVAPWRFASRRELLLRVQKVVVMLLMLLREHRDPCLYL